MERKYDSDLTDQQWRKVSRLLPPINRIGRPPLNRRSVINAIMYLVRTGCQWRMLPRDFPNWKSVYTIFRRWREAEIWKKIHDQLRDSVRKLSGKKPQPTVGIIDSQSVKTTEVGGVERGYDAAKKIVGRKRHLIVDTLGMILGVVVHGGYWQDELAAPLVLMRVKSAFSKMKVVFADSAYARNKLPQWVKQTCGFGLQCVKRSTGTKGFVPLPKRWIVERTFAWIGKSRRHSKDYQRTVESSEAMIYIAMIRIMLNRIKK